MCDHCDKCSHTLSDEQLKKIVDMTIDEMTERAYQEVGKKVVSGLGWFFGVVGVVTLSLYAILKSKGIIS